MIVSSYVSNADVKVTIILPQSSALVRISITVMKHYEHKLLEEEKDYMLTCLHPSLKEGSAGIQAGQDPRGRN